MARRKKDTQGPYLAWRVRLFSGAAILTVAGMYSDLQWLIWGAIVLLALAFGLRFLPNDQSHEEDGPHPDPDEDEGHVGGA